VALLTDLFDAPIETAEVDPFRDSIDELLPEESALIGRAVPERLLEFKAGRHCARVALGRLGGTGPVLRAEDRSPIWPPGFVGSIAHTRRLSNGFCCAAVARASVARALGLDVEFDRPLETKLWSRVLRKSEVDWITSLPDPERGHMGMLVFSAKESVYKCQHPLSGKFLEFADVEVAEPDNGEFQATLMRAAAPLPAGFVFDGRFLRRCGLVATGVVLTR
jgi:4'-phosphopantetheinyl transferase EntD